MIRTSNICAVAPPLPIDIVLQVLNSREASHNRFIFKQPTRKFQYTRTSPGKLCFIQTVGTFSRKISRNEQRTCEHQLVCSGATATAVGGQKAQACRTGSRRDRYCILYVYKFHLIQHRLIFLNIFRSRTQINVHVLCCLNFYSGTFVSECECIYKPPDFSAARKYWGKFCCLYNRLPTKYTEDVPLKNDWNISESEK